MLGDDGELRLLRVSSLVRILAMFAPVTITLLARTEALAAALELPQGQRQVPPVPHHDDHPLVLDPGLLVHVNDL